jgi:hypothetical protein
LLDKKSKSKFILRSIPQFHTSAVAATEKDFENASLLPLHCGNILFRESLQECN